MNEGVTSCGKPSRGRYVQGCRCYMCRVANAEYATRHAHDGAFAMVGEPETAEARKRVNRWRGRGIGLRTIELWTGVPRSSLRTLVDGKHQNCRGLPKRMSRENYEAIMGARPDNARGAYVDARFANDALSKLRGRGWTYARISRESGLPLSTVHSLAYRPRTRCTKSTHDALTALWRHEAHGHFARVGGVGGRAPTLEDWQWQEARADYIHGTDAAALASRYGVGKQTILLHMRKHGCVFASAAGIGGKRLMA